MTVQHYISGEDYQQQLQQRPKLSRKSSLPFPITWVVIAILITGGLGAFAYLRPTNTGNTGNMGIGGINYSGGSPNGPAPGGGAPNGPAPGGGSPGGGPSTGGGGNCSGPGPCLSANAGAAPIPGKVTAVSSTSITISPSLGGSAETFSITSDTTEESSSGASKAFNANDVQIGQTVGIVPTTTGGTVAQQVQLNFIAKSQ